MKKLIQASLIIIVVFVMVQAVMGGTLSLIGQTRSNEIQSTHFTTLVPVQYVQLLICSDSSGISCMRPNVGWNS